MPEEIDEGFGDSPTAFKSDWFYAHNNRSKQGPFSWQQLRQLAKEGELKLSDMILRDGGGIWTVAASLEGLFFLEDLKKVSSEIKTPEDFILLLSELIQNQRTKKKLRRDKFFSDLGKIFSQLERLKPGQDLPLLADSMSKWRSHANERMLKHLEKLPKDDPLHCPLSLFEPMNFSRLETAQTHALAWFLNPDKKHGFGGRLIEELLFEVAGVPWLWGSLEVKEVESEREIKLGHETGRLDVYARGTWIDEEEKKVPWMLVIEAKVDALESPVGLPLYEKWMKSQGAKEEIKVFLTPDGRPPETAKTDEWIAMSFLELACCFRRAFDELHDRAGYQLLRHYLTGIFRDLCRWEIPLKRNLDSCHDPYSVVDYLKVLHQKQKRG